MNMQRKRNCVLSSVKEGREAVVLALSGGKENNRRLVEMGIIPGVRITLLSGSKNRPFLVKVHNSRVMIGWSSAEKIVVKEF